MEDIKTSPKSLRSLVGEINKGKYNFSTPRFNNFLFCQ